MKNRITDIIVIASKSILKEAKRQAKHTKTEHAVINGNSRNRADVMVDVSKVVGSNAKGLIFIDVTADNDGKEDMLKITKLFGEVAGIRTVGDWE